MASLQFHRIWIPFAFFMFCIGPLWVKYLRALERLERRWAEFRGILPLRIKDLPTLVDPDRDLKVETTIGENGIHNDSCVSGSGTIITHMATWKKHGVVETVIVRRTWKRDMSLMFVGGKLVTFELFDPRVKLSPELGIRLQKDLDLFMFRLRTLSPVPRGPNAYRIAFKTSPV